MGQENKSFSSFAPSRETWFFEALKFLTRSPNAKTLLLAGARNEIPRLRASLPHHQTDLSS